VKTPYFLLNEARLRENGERLRSIRERTGCKILLALKAFSCWPVFPLLRPFLDGVCASSPWEAQLGREEFGGEVHAFAAAYSESDFLKLNTLCNEIDFNSFSQLERFRPLMHPKVRYGLRINPECSTQPVEHALYDPCAPRSRLGILREQFKGHSLEGISGLHFHTLCEQNADALATTLQAVEEKFGDLLPQMEWINFGGGHHITRPDYDLDQLCGLIIEFQKKYKLQVYLEPGEATALHAGTLVASVLDIIEHDGAIAILDLSCTCHMPDVLEMPYRPEIKNASSANEKKWTYRLAGSSCLAGDVIGDYSFDTPLRPGDSLEFLDMAHYTMVKTTFFNGIQHPSIALQKEDGTLQVLRQFSYSDFKQRLG
jgi:carboxynorspermidine decarboxylase